VTLCLTGAGTRAARADGTASRTALPAAAALPGNGFTPLNPTRALDTRASRAFQTGDELVVEVGAVAGMPANAVAATLNLTATDATGTGWLAVRACGTPPVGTSALNFDAGRMVAAGVTAPMSAAGTVCVTGDVVGSVQVIVDVTGAYSPTGSAYTSVPPSRLVDTRAGAPVGGGATRAVNVASASFVPPDAVAAALLVTVTVPSATGWLTVFPCGQSDGGTSTINFAAGQTVANLTVAKLGNAGAVCVRPNVTTHVVIDIAGWYGPAGTLRYVPDAPTRLVDTRGGAPVSAGTSFTVANGIPPGALAAALTATVTGPSSAGWITALPCGTALPATSNGNFVRGQTVATAVAAAASHAGATCLRPTATTHLIVDRTGWFVPLSSGPSLASLMVTVPSVGSVPGPTAMATRPGEPGAVYITEQGGRVRVHRNGALVTAPVVDITALTNANGEQGLLGLAFSPDGTKMYLHYTDLNGDTNLDELTFSNGTWGSRRRVLFQTQPYSNHNGGQILFGPDGKLYMGLGDGGSAGDPENRAQNLGTLIGKILRIDPTPSGGGAYTVPADNPFVGMQGIRPEIWAYGVRNPWRFSFDAPTGDLWVGDVGQNAVEEIDRLPAVSGQGRGANLGWAQLEGTAPFKGTFVAGSTPPWFDYRHGPLCSITGGFVYHGTAISRLAGAYVYSDFCSGGVRAIDPRNPAAGSALLSATPSSATTFGQVDGGELWIAATNGTISRLAP